MKRIIPALLLALLLPLTALAYPLHLPETDLVLPLPDGMHATEQPIRDGLTAIAVTQDTTLHYVLLSLDTPIEQAPPPKDALLAALMALPFDGATARPLTFTSSFPQDDPALPYTSITRVKLPAFTDTQHLYAFALQRDDQHYVAPETFMEFARAVLPATNHAQLTLDAAQSRRLTDRIPLPDGFEIMEDTSADDGDVLTAIYAYGDLTEGALAYAMIAVARDSLGYMHPVAWGDDLTLHLNKLIIRNLGLEQGMYTETLHTAPSPWAELTAGSANGEQGYFVSWYENDWAYLFGLMGYPEYTAADREAFVAFVRENTPVGLGPHAAAVMRPYMSQALGREVLIPDGMEVMEDAIVDDAGIRSLMAVDTGAKHDSAWGVLVVEIDADALDAAMAQAGVEEPLEAPMALFYAASSLRDEGYSVTMQEGMLVTRDENGLVFGVTSMDGGTVRTVVVLSDPMPLAQFQLDALTIMRESLN